MEGVRPSLFLALLLLLPSGGAVCYAQPMDGTALHSRGLTRPASTGVEASELGTAGNPLSATIEPRHPRAPLLPPHTLQANAPRVYDAASRSKNRMSPLSPTRVLAEAVQPYVADGPFDRMSAHAPVRTIGGPPQLPQQSAQQDNGNVRLYILIGAAVLAAGWLSYAVLTRNDDEGTPPPPPPRPQPQ